MNRKIISTVISGILAISAASAIPSYSVSSVVIGSGSVPVPPLGSASFIPTSLPSAASVTANSFSFIPKAVGSLGINSLVNDVLLFEHSIALSRSLRLASFISSLSGSSLTSLGLGSVGDMSSIAAVSAPLNSLVSLTSGPSLGAPISMVNSSANLGSSASSVASLPVNSLLGSLNPLQLMPGFSLAHAAATTASNKINSMGSIASVAISGFTSL